MIKDINDCHPIPPSRYRYFLGEVEARLRRINALPDSDETKLSLLKGALRSILGQLDA